MDEESDKIQRLEERIDQLEDTIAKMLPGRRDALKLGGAAVIGAAAMSGTASAGSSQVGTIGDGSNLVDINAEDIFNLDTINGDNIVTVRDSVDESGDYQIRKGDDTDDGTGVINFKTS